MTQEQQTELMKFYNKKAREAGGGQFYRCVTESGHVTTVWGRHTIDAIGTLMEANDRAVSVLTLS